MWLNLLNPEKKEKLEFMKLMEHAVIKKSTLTYNSEKKNLTLEFKRITQRHKKKFLFISYESFNHDLDSTRCILTIRNVEKFDIHNKKDAIKIEDNEICTFTKIENNQIFIGSFCDHDKDPYLISLKVKNIDLTLEDINEVGE